MKLANEWFLANKLSPNAKVQKKTKYVLFHKVSMCDSLPSQLPTMTFHNIEIKRENSIRFLGVIIDENLTWKNHTEVVENKSSISPSFTFTSIMLILLGIVLLKLNSRES